MIFGVIAANDEESRFFAVSATDLEQAKYFVRASLDGKYTLRAQNLEALLSEQYQQLAELSVI